jgi:hypothetical protein
LFSTLTEDAQLENQQARKQTQAEPAEEVVPKKVNETQTPEDPAEMAVDAKTNNGSGEEEEGMSSNQVDSPPSEPNSPKENAAEKTFESKNIDANKDNRGKGMEADTSTNQDLSIAAGKTGKFPSVQLSQTIPGDVSRNEILT